MSTWIVNALLPQNAIELGRLVVSIEDPEQDYYNAPSPGSSTWSTSTADEVLASCYESFQESFTRARGWGLREFLTRFFSISYNTQNDHGKCEILHFENGKELHLA